MKKIILFLFIYVFSFGCLDTAFANEVAQDNVKQEIVKPEVEAHGAVLMDFETGRVLWGKDEHKPLAMASTTKIMTAIVALENSKLDDIVTVSQKAALTPPVKMFLTKGEKISMSALLHALMMQSSNDAAVAIAEHIGGSVEGFCSMMTEQAKKIGAKDTIFETPNGLDFGDHHSTAYDLAVIARYALRNKTFMNIINTQNITVKSDTSTYSIYNKNRLLNEFSGANGIKTGYTGKAGHCFVGAAKRDGMQLISVVLASGWGPKGKEQKWVDTKEVLSYGFKNFKYEVLLEEGEPAGNVAVTRSKSDAVGTYFSNGLVLPLNREEKQNVKVEIDLPDEIKAPVTLNEKVGIAKVYLGDDLLGEIDLLTADIAKRFDLKTCSESVLNTFAQMATKNDTRIELPEATFWK